MDCSAWFAAWISVVPRKRGFFFFFFFFEDFFIGVWPLGKEGANGGLPLGFIG